MCIRAVRDAILPILIAVATLLVAGCNGDDISIHKPDESNFYVPDNAEPLSVLLSLPDGWPEGGPIWSIGLKDEDDTFVYRQGYVPMNGRIVTINPGGIEAQERLLAIPETTDPGWHRLEVIALRTTDDGDTEVVSGESGRFWISKVGFEGNAGLDAFVDSRYVAGDPVVITLFPYDEISSGYDCSAPVSDIDVMLFKGGSHGASHQHWSLETSGANSFSVTVAIPEDAAPGTDYFFHVDRGVTCNGTSDYFEIASP